MATSLHVVITGRVQGVWYRKSTYDKALALGLAGWVKNLPTGEVEACFEGEEGLVEEMLSWCYEGPPLAQVLKIEAKRGAATGLTPPFEIR